MPCGCGDAEVFHGGLIGTKRVDVSFECQKGLWVRQSACDRYTVIFFVMLVTMLLTKRVVLLVLARARPVIAVAAVVAIAVAVADAIVVADVAVADAIVLVVAAVAVIVAVVAAAVVQLDVLRAVVLD